MKMNEMKWSSQYSTLFQLLELCKIISLIGDYSEKGMEYLFIKSNKDIFMDSSLPNIKDISKLILANNLVSSISGENNPLLKQIIKYLQEGETYIKNLLSPGDDSEELYKIDEGHRIFLEEMDDLEFKGSFSIDINRFVYNKKKLEKSDEIQYSFLKSVAGMLNGNGGEIYLGVLEGDRYNNPKFKDNLDILGAIYIRDKIVLGVEPELKVMKKNVDQHILKISETMRNRIKNDVMQWVKIIPESFNKKRTIYCISIQPYPDIHGVTLKEKQKDKAEKYYIRENNNTQEYSPRDFYTIKLKKEQLIKSG